MHLLHVAVLERLEIAGPDEAVDHEAHRPGQVGRHQLFGPANLVACAHSLVRDGVSLATQAARAAKNLPVLAGREGAARHAPLALVVRAGAPAAHTSTGPLLQQKQEKEQQSLQQ